MSISIDIAIEAESWHTNDVGDLSHKAVQAALSVLKQTREGELSIAFVDDERIQSLNRSFRQKDKPTNVLSFPMDGAMLGDIVLAHQTIAQEAQHQGKTFEHHLTHLIIHGFLHLCGYDHMDDDSAAEMEALEIAALAQLGIDNPYELKER